MQCSSHFNTFIKLPVVVMFLTFPNSIYHKLYHISFSLDNFYLPGLAWKHKKSGYFIFFFQFWHCMSLPRWVEMEVPGKGTWTNWWVENCRSIILRPPFASSSSTSSDAHTHTHLRRRRLRRCRRYHTALSISFIYILLYISEIKWKS